MISVYSSASANDTPQKDSTDSVHIVTDLVISVGISKCDIIDFQPIDDVPVRLLFMIAAAYNQHAYYLQTLSFFSSKLKNKELRDALLAVEDPMEAYKLLTE